MSVDGVLFGDLVYRKRGIEGLTQQQLSDRSGVPKERISLLETGTIGRPQTRTVDQLCVALNITDEELNACKVRVGQASPRTRALRSGYAKSDATDLEIDAFLEDRDREQGERKIALAKLNGPSGRVSELFRNAEDAFAAGRAGTADDLLREADAMLISAITAALQDLSALKRERGNIALYRGNVGEAGAHFEQACGLFSGIDPDLEANSRDGSIELLRTYAYRYKNVAALHAARSALVRNEKIWAAKESVKELCRTHNALGHVNYRLAEFDAPRRAKTYLLKAKSHHEQVIERCSHDSLTKELAVANYMLANIYANRNLAESDDAHAERLERALKLQESALTGLSRKDDTHEWGVVQHNMAATRVQLAALRLGREAKISDLNIAVRHIKLALRVRSPEADVTYWAASCVVMGCALVDLALLSNGRKRRFIQQAKQILNDASDRMSARSYPNQWTQIQYQLSRCAKLDSALR